MKRKKNQTLIAKLKNNNKIKRYTEDQKPLGGDYLFDTGLDLTDLYRK